MTSVKTRIVAVFLSIVMCFSIAVPAASAASDSKLVDDSIVSDVESIFSGLSDVESMDDFKDNTMKVLYNILNVVVEALVQGIAALIPAPKSWIDMDKFDDSLILKGRDTYATEAKAGNEWSLGYSSRSLVPEDIESGKYYIGRDLNNRMAKGVYDDMRIRIAAVDDGSGDGITLIGAIDSLGVNSTDIRSIREGVLKAFADKGVKISGINIMATHSHTALDTQGVATEFVYKLLTASFVNLFDIKKQSKLEAADYFKSYFIEQSVIAATEAINNLEPGKMFFSEVDISQYCKDKRGLVSKEDLPKAAVLKFIPNSGEASTYLMNNTCHPTSFPSSAELVSSDYIYFLDQYIQEHDNGSHLVMFQGSLGQISRDNIIGDKTGLDEWEALGCSTKETGENFGRLVLAADFSEELEPIINEKHEVMWLYPENTILLLACKINLVNQQVCYDKDGNKAIASEIGYVEFGHKVGFAMFPGEFYPEVFWGHEIIGDTTWDGSEWPFESPHNAISGVSIYCVSLANDATGYVVTDDNFAFMGHIIGDSVADETLSAGKHQGSYQIGKFYDLIEEFR